MQLATFFKQCIRQWRDNNLMLNQRHVARSIWQAIGEFEN
jgi:hypothetical protein